MYLHLEGKTSTTKIPAFMTDQETDQSLEAVTAAEIASSSEIETVKEASKRETSILFLAAAL